MFCVKHYHQITFNSFDKFEKVSFLIHFFKVFLTLCLTGNTTNVQHLDPMLFHYRMHYSNTRHTGFMVDFVQCKRCKVAFIWKCVLTIPLKWTILKLGEVNYKNTLQPVSFNTHLISPFLLEDTYRALKTLMQLINIFPAMQSIWKFVQYTRHLKGAIYHSGGRKFWFLLLSSLFSWLYLTWITKYKFNGFRDGY